MTMCKITTVLNPQKHDIPKGRREKMYVDGVYMKKATIPELESQIKNENDLNEKEQQGENKQKTAMLMLAYVRVDR